MDESEAIVEKLLKHQGFTSIVYEPDGNIPPDFLADGRVAVEVRRLNQNFDSSQGKQGLEEVAIPLWQKIEKLAHSLGPPSENSWFLFFHFGRPMKPWKALEPKLKTALVAFMNQPNRSNGRIFTDGDFEVEAFEASDSLQTYFRMGGSIDHQSGGFIVAEMLNNILHIADEKSKKISKFRNKYKEWWLVLTDYIGFGLSDLDKQQLLTNIRRPTGWDKIVIVSPIDSTKWFEI